MRGRDKFNRHKRSIRMLCSFYRLFSKQHLKRLLVKKRSKKGTIAMVVRYAILYNLVKHLGDNVSIHPDVYIFNPETLSIGNNVSIHPMTYIEAFGGVDIGNDVSIAHGVSIISVNHSFNQKDIPIKEQPLLPKRIIVGDNVWVGAKACILAGVTVQNGCVIAASAVVTKDVKENSVVAGIPARIIRER